MGMVRINYEQTEQLRECSAEMQKPLSQLVAEAVNYWLAVVAPAKLDALRAHHHRHLYPESTRNNDQAH
jgi:hypothetical protein